MKRFIAPTLTPRHPFWVDVGLLAARLGFGFSLLSAHGLSKMQMVFDGQAAGFPDPIGLGSTLSLWLACFVECICSTLVMVGLLTRFASLMVVVTMAVALIVVHAGQAWSERELAALYGLAFATLLITGPGAMSLDAVLQKKLAAQQTAPPAGVVNRKNVAPRTG